MRTFLWTAGGAVLLGGVGLFGGMLLPVLIFPEANQGPLIGIVFTGPIGVVLGAIIGYIKGRKSK